MSALSELLIILVLLVINGLLAMSEIAIVSARKTRLKQLAEAGHKRARIALRLADNPGNFLSTVQVGISLVGVLAGAFGGATLANRLTPYIERVPVAFVFAYAEEIAFGIVVMFITYLSLVVGELVPKQIALRNAEKIAMLVARPMVNLARFTHPLVHVLSISSNAILRLVTKGSVQEPIITEDEVKLIIRQAAEAGVVKSVEEDMIFGVLRLGDLRVTDLMTPRPEIVLLDEVEAPEKNWQKVIEAGHSYFPVYNRDPSTIVGIVSVKALWAQVVAGRTPTIKAAMKPPLFVPETMTALKLLEKFKSSKTHMALVLDEHGGIEGLVSINDVLEGVVGEMPTLGEVEEPEVVRRDDGSWLLDGGMSATDVKELLKLKKLPREDGSYTTVGGLVMTRLGRIPRTGESFKWRGYRFEVVDMDRHRVDKVLVTLMPKSTTPKKGAGGRADKKGEGGGAEKRDPGEDA